MRDNWNFERALDQAPPYAPDAYVGVTYDSVNGEVEMAVPFEGTIQDAPQVRQVVFVVRLDPNASNQQRAKNDAVITAHEIGGEPYPA